MPTCHLLYCFWKKIILWQKWFEIFCHLLLVYIYQPGKWAVKYMRVRVNLWFVRFFDVFFFWNVLTLRYILFFQFLITPLLTANVYFFPLLISVSKNRSVWTRQIILYIKIVFITSLNLNQYSRENQSKVMSWVIKIRNNKYIGYWKLDLWPSSVLWCWLRFSHENDVCSSLPPILSYLRYLCLFAYSGVQYYIVFCLCFFVFAQCCQFLWIDHI